LQTNSRNILLDILKVIAATVVITIHCEFLLVYSKLAHHVTSNSLFRITIPFFFCINGFFLCTIFQNKRLKIWGKRVGILYIIWMLIFAYFWLPPIYTNPLKVAATFIFGFNHLWYLAALFPAGFLLYGIRKCSNKTLLIGAVVLYLTGYTIQTLGNLNAFSEPSIVSKLVNYSPIHRNFLFFALPFLSIGYVFRRTNFHQKVTKTKAITALIASFILLIVESLISFYMYTEATFNMSISFLLFGPALFLTAFAFSINSRLNGKTISSFSIAIYLVHPLIIVISARLLKLESTPLTFATIIGTWIASYLLILLNKKLKYIL
jgi:surface polysaccharide O-acyltransferase-like enzyme